MKRELTLDEIREHWKNWATSYGTDLRATTKASTAKRIELNTLVKTVKSIQDSFSDEPKLLEIGCGNGHNLIALHERFPHFRLLGIDYIEEMIESAEKLRVERGISTESVEFRVGNVLNLENLSADYDLVYTVRCLINLNSDRLQQEAIFGISRKIRSGGYLLMLENSANTYENQNRLRVLAGLEARTPAEFNHFINEDALFGCLPAAGLELVKTEDYISFHDIVLYVLLPMVNDGALDYGNPLVDAAARLSIAMSECGGGDLGQYGQNRLYLCLKH
ncbi:class I SAM-dependent methyltransferase [Pseudomonadota bacterium]